MRTTIIKSTSGRHEITLCRGCTEQLRGNMEECMSSHHFPPVDPRYAAPGLTGMLVQDIYVGQGDNGPGDLVVHFRNNMRATLTREVGKLESEIAKAKRFNSAAFMASGTPTPAAE